MINSNEKRSFRFLRKSKRLLPKFFQLGMILASKWTYLLHKGERTGDLHALSDHRILFDPNEYLDQKQIRFASFSPNDPVNRWMRYYDEGYILFNKVIVISEKD